MRHNGGLGLEITEQNERGTGGHGENTSDTEQFEQEPTGQSDPNGQADDSDGTPNKNRIKTGSGRSDERTDTAELD